MAPERLLWWSTQVFFAKHCYDYYIHPKWTLTTCCSMRSCSAIQSLALLACRMSLQSSKSVNRTNSLRKGAVAPFSSAFNLLVLVRHMHPQLLLLTMTPSMTQSVGANVMLVRLIRSRNKRGLQKVWRPRSHWSIQLGNTVVTNFWSFQLILSTQRFAQLYGV